MNSLSTALLCPLPGAPESKAFEVQVCRCLDDRAAERFFPAVLTSPFVIHLYHHEDSVGS